jgi:hypothetical protein
MERLDSIEDLGVLLARQGMPENRIRKVANTWKEKGLLKRLNEKVNVFEDLVDWLPIRDYLDVSVENFISDAQIQTFLSSLRAQSFDKRMDDASRVHRKLQTLAAYEKLSAQEIVDLIPLNPSPNMGESDRYREVKHRYLSDMQKSFLNRGPSLKQKLKYVSLLGPDEINLPVIWSARGAGEFVSLLHKAGFFMGNAIRWTPSIEGRFFELNPSVEVILWARHLLEDLDLVQSEFVGRALLRAKTARDYVKILHCDMSGGEPRCKDKFRQLMEKQIAGSYDHLLSLNPSRSDLRAVREFLPFSINAGLAEKFEDDMKSRSIIGKCKSWFANLNE